jgi:hypothetical protein
MIHAPRQRYRQHAAKTPNTHSGGTTATVAHFVLLAFSLGYSYVCDSQSMPPVVIMAKGARDGPRPLHVPTIDVYHHVLTVGWAQDSLSPVGGVAA